MGILRGEQKDVRNTTPGTRKAGRRLSERSVKSGIVFALKSLFFAGLLFVTVFLGLVLFLPLPKAPVPQATKVYDIKGRPVSSLFVENRTVIPSDMGCLRIVAVEDMRFTPPRVRYTSLAGPPQEPQGPKRRG